MIALLWRNGRLDKVTEANWHPLEFHEPFLDKEGFDSWRYRLVRLHQGGELADYCYVGRKSETVTSK